MDGRIGWVGYSVRQARRDNGTSAAVAVAVSPQVKNPYAYRAEYLVSSGERSYK